MDVTGFNIDRLHSYQSTHECVPRAACIVLRVSCIVPCAFVCSFAVYEACQYRLYISHPSVENTARVARKCSQSCRERDSTRCCRYTDPPTVVTGGGLFFFWVAQCCFLRFLIGVDGALMYCAATVPLLDTVGHRYRGARVVESLGNVYKCHYPHKPTKTARNVKRSVNDSHARDKTYSLYICQSY